MERSVVCCTRFTQTAKSQPMTVHLLLFQGQGESQEFHLRSGIFKVIMKVRGVQVWPGKFHMFNHTFLMSVNYTLCSTTRLTLLTAVFWFRWILFDDTKGQTCSPSLREHILSLSNFNSVSLYKILQPFLKKLQNGHPMVLFLAEKLPKSLKSLHENVQQDIYTRTKCYKSSAKCTLIS